MVIGGIETLNQNRIANRFNKIFPEIGPKLSSSIPTYSKDFKQFMEVSETVLLEYNLQDEEFEEAFNSLKSNKSPRFDRISSSVVNFCISGIFYAPKRWINRIFPNGMKIKQTLGLLFLKFEELFFTNFRTISVLHVSPTYWRG